MIPPADSGLEFFWVAEIPCDASLCWTTLILAWSSAPTTQHRSLLTLGMCFPPNSNQCRCLTKTSTQHGHMVGVKLYGLQKIYCTNPRHLHMILFLPHTVHLIYEEFLLVSHFHHEFDTVMFFMKSDEVWHHSGLVIVLRSRTDCYLPGSEYNVATKCPLEFHFSDANIFRKKIKSRSTLMILYKAQ
jgi:hypothetical protein